MGPLFVFIFVLIGIVIGSLIPAFFAKLLMKWIFGRRVFFGMVLLATVLGTIFAAAAFVGLMWFAEGTLDLQTVESFEENMSAAETGLAWLFGFLLQLVILSLVVPDENMELIASWKWAVVIVLQYVLFFVIVIALVFILASIGTFAEASPILTRVV